MDRLLSYLSHSFMDVESDNMAVRLALAETRIIDETKKAFVDEVPPALAPAPAPTAIPNSATIQWNDMHMDMCMDMFMDICIDMSIGGHMHSRTSWCVDLYIAVRRPIYRA